MFDSQKIDSYFDDKAAYSSRSLTSKHKQVAWRRLFKLILPCLAAILLGVLVVIPNIKKNTDLKSAATMPRKNEMEQLHMEETIFNITDNKNRVNKIVADSVDEVEAGSQRYKIINPKATLPTDTGTTDISADVGFFNQQNNVLELKKNVRTKAEKNTLITTESAIYDFDNDKGWGDAPVAAKGDWGTMTAAAFTYDKINELLVLKGKHQIITERGILTAEEQTQIFRNENKTISHGNAMVTQNDKKLYADKIVAYFTESSKKELLRVEAYGNVRLVSPKETIIGAKGMYDVSRGVVEMYADNNHNKTNANYVLAKQGKNELRAKYLQLNLSGTEHKEISKVYATGNIMVQTPSEIITGSEGYYFPQIGKLELYGITKGAPEHRQMVVIKQGENVLFARRVEVWLDRNNQITQAKAFDSVEIETPKGLAFGDRGVYNPEQKKVELFDNVRLEQNGNFIFGAHAETDLETSVSRITGNETTGGRIRGTFYKKRKENNGFNAKK